MPRPLRIEFENAHYHVMHRAIAGRSAFSSAEAYQAFLNILGETCIRYEVQVFAYCLVHNQYHLLLKTPKGNLSRAMQHINSVYTQYINRLNVVDGPLFKGRFKAVLVEPGEMLLLLSMYIHRRPNAIRKPVVKHLVDYTWSSYRAYIGQVEPFDWLVPDTLLTMIKGENKAQGYADDMAASLDEGVQQWYGKRYLPSVIGSQKFKASLMTRGQR